MSPPESGGASGWGKGVLRVLWGGSSFGGFSARRSPWGSAPPIGTGKILSGLSANIANIEKRKKCRKCKYPRAALLLWLKQSGGQEEPNPIVCFVFPPQKSQTVNHAIHSLLS